MYTLRLKSWNGSEILAEYQLEAITNFPSRTTFLVNGLHYTPLKWVFDLENRVVVAEVRNYSDEYYSQQTYAGEMQLTNGMVLSQYHVPEPYRESWVDSSGKTN